jgi:hypothetical protein
MRKFTVDPKALPPNSAAYPSASVQAPKRNSGNAPTTKAVLPVVGRFYCYHEAALIFGKSPRTIRLWVKNGRLKAIKIDRIRLIPDTEIIRMTGYAVGQRT